MTVAALVRVSVVAGGRRLDLAVPPALPVAELVPGLARSLGVVSSDGLRLCSVTGAVLDERAGLAQQDVPDGAVLTLAPPPPPPLVHDDPAEALAATAPPGEPPRWWPMPCAATLLLLAAAVLTAAHEARVAAVLSLLLLAVGLGLARAAPAAALVASLAASTYAALAAAILVGGQRPGPGVAWAAAGGAVLAVAALAMTALASHRLLMLPALVVGVTSAAVGAVLSVRDVPFGVLAGLLLALAAVLAGGAPWVAVGRITRPRGRVDVAALAREARTARELLLGLSVGLAAVHVALVGPVAASGACGAALAGCASAFVLLRSRHHAAPAEALSGLVTGGVGLLVTSAVTLWLHEPWRPVGALVLAGVGGLLLAWPRGRPSLLGPPLLRAAETACLVALLPLVVLTGDLLARLP